MALISTLLFRMWQFVFDLFFWLRVGDKGKSQGILFGLSYQNSFYSTSQGANPRALQPLFVLCADTGSVAILMINSGTRAMTPCGPTTNTLGQGLHLVPHPIYPYSVAHGGMMTFGVVRLCTGWWPYWCCPRCASKTRKLIRKSSRDCSYPRFRLLSFYTIKHS